MKSRRAWMLVGSLLLLVGLVVPVVVVGATSAPTAERRAVESTSSLVAGGEELVGERTKTSQTFRTARGAFVTRVYGSAINTPQAGGELARSQTELSASSSVLRFRGDELDAQLPQRLSAGSVKVTSDGGSIGYQLADASGGAAVVTGASARYADARPSTDITVTTLADGVKEDLTLKSSAAPTKFVFDLTVPEAATARLTKNGGVAIDLRGDEDFEVAPPFMLDRARAFAPKGAASYQLTKSDGGYRLSLSLDGDWLQDSDRLFPVTVDPTIRRTGTAQTTDVSLIESVPNTGYGGSQGIFVGRYAAYPTTDSRGGLKFDLTSAVPADARVLQATVGLKSYYKENSTAKKVGLHPLTRGFTHDATWNRYNATSAWTTAGGEFDARPATVTSIGTSLGWHYWYPTELAQQWVNGSRVNNGFVLKDVAGEPKNGTEFRSSEYGTAADRPYLDIVWHPRTGVTDQAAFHDHPLADGTVLQANVFNGNLFFERHDVDGTGPGTDFSMRRYFNSKAADADPIHSGFSPGVWSSSNGKFVGGTVMSNGDFVHQAESGSLVPFLKQADGSYKSPPELEGSTLAKSSSAPWGQRYSLTLADGTVKYFGEDGTWTSQKDAANNTFALNYPSPSYLHTSVTGTNGQNTTFEYVGSSGNERTSKTTNPASQYVTYTHTSDRLTSEARNGATQLTYGYDSNGRLNRITDSAGRVTQVSIDSSNRVTQIIDGPNSTDPTTTFAYAAASAPCAAPAVRKTTVTVPGGTVHAYCTDVNGGLVDVETSPSTAESPVLEDLASEQYAGEFNVTQLVAREALRLQGRADGLGEEVNASSSGGGYAGYWFDNTSRRVKVGLKTGTNSTGAQQKITARGIAADTDIVYVANTIGELEQARDTMLTTLSDLVDAGKVGVGFRPQGNALTVTTATGLTSTEQGRVTTARSSAGVATTLVVEPTANITPELAACNVLVCDPPARGGRAIDGPDRSCTGGFVARSRSDQLPYLITAGHCVRDGGSGPWNIFTSDGDKQLGFPANWEFGDSGDFGLIGISGSAFTGNLQPWVYIENVRTRTPGGRLIMRRHDPSYTIRLAERNFAGRTVCYTGQFSGTVCGQTVELGAKRAGAGSLAIWRAHECGPGKKITKSVVKGDSGGPFFMNRRAKGFMSVMSLTDRCVAYYSGAVVAQDELNVEILTPSP